MPRAVALAGRGRAGATIVRATPQGARGSAEHLLGRHRARRRTAPATDGRRRAPVSSWSPTARRRRTEKAPGHLDERAAGFDDGVGDGAARPATRSALAGLDAALGDGAAGPSTPAPAARSGELAAPGDGREVDYDDDPFGVQYWVVRWTCES